MDFKEEQPIEKQYQLNVEDTPNKDQMSDL